MTVYCGVDLHTRQQLVKWCDTRDGEIKEQRLSHDSLDAVRSFYPQFTGAVVVGREACGYSGWFEQLLQGVGHEVRIGDATQVRYRARSRQETDRGDAEPPLDLLLEGEFPRINRLCFESLEVLRRLRYRHRLVQMRGRVRNSLQSIAHGRGVTLGSKLRTRRGRECLSTLPLSPVLSRQRAGWLEMIAELDRRSARVEEELGQVAAGDGRVPRLRTHPGVGRLTGLALVHTLCPVSRFADSRKVTASCRAMRSIMRYLKLVALRGGLLLELFIGPKCLSTWLSDRRRSSRGSRLLRARVTPRGPVDARMDD